MAAIVFDTKPLLLLVVGMTSRAIIERHKVISYTEPDFDVLLNVLQSYSQVITTPGVIAETSNWAGYISGEDGRRVTLSFQAWISGSREYYRSARDIASSEPFVRLGFADASVLQASKRGTLLTDDLPLYLEAERLRIRVVNFNHLRVQAGTI